MCARPVIAVPADRRMLDPHPFHVVREKYINAIEQCAAGLPRIVPASGVPTDELLSRMMACWKHSMQTVLTVLHWASSGILNGTAWIMSFCWRCLWLLAMRAGITPIVARAASEGDLGQGKQNGLKRFNRR